MNIELNKTELELLDEALQSWEREPTSGAMVGSMIGMIMADDKDRMQAVADKQRQEANKKVKERRYRSTLLRAKLLQALNRESEFPMEKESQ
jgi:hypothetical protein